MAEAFALRRECRAEYEDYLNAQVAQAERACNGRLLSDDGYELQIDPRSLFLGSTDRANLYASEELVDWWRDHRRLNYRMYEAQWVRGRERHDDDDSEPF